MCCGLSNELHFYTIWYLKQFVFTHFSHTRLFVLCWTQLSLHHQAHDRESCLGHAGTDILHWDQTNSASVLASAKCFTGQVYIKHNVPFTLCFFWSHCRWFWFKSWSRGLKVVKSFIIMPLASIWACIVKHVQNCFGNLVRFWTSVTFRRNDIHDLTEHHLRMYLLFWAFPSKIPLT